MELLSILNIRMHSQDLSDHNKNKPRQQFIIATSWYLGFIHKSKYFKKQLFQNHKDINPKLTKEEVETLIENEKKDVIKEFKKYDLKFSINLDKHRNEVKNVDDRLLKLKLSDQHLNTEIRQLRFFLKQNESIREDIMENSKYLSK